MSLFVNIPKKINVTIDSRQECPYRSYDLNSEIYDYVCDQHGELCAEIDINPFPDNCPLPELDTSGVDMPPLQKVMHYCILEIASRLKKIGSYNGPPMIEVAYEYIKKWKAK